MKEPSLLVSDSGGNIFEIEEYAAVGRAGNRFNEISEQEWIPLPTGSDIFMLPDRIPVGKNRKTGIIEPLSEYEGIELFPVAAFAAPAHTLLYLSAFKKREKAKLLPLFAYGAAGILKEQILTTALRIDQDIRQDLSNFNPYTVEKRAAEMERRFRHNRLAIHLINNCVRKYGCPAARNFVLNRWEMPLPTSTGCNARCLGCISKQSNSGIPPTQERLSFKPTAEEIIELVLFHFETAPNPVASFGQGCEGEPLTNPELLIQTTKKIRKLTKKGILNLNTNGSKPDVIKELCRAGMDSFRISLNSAQPEFYLAYFQPLNYGFEDVLESMRVILKENRFLSLNYFVFPGFTDSINELKALCRLLDEIPVNMIQWRNLNMDPDRYLSSLPFTSSNSLGIRTIIDRLKTLYPALRHGYFNPYKT